MASNPRMVYDTKKNSVLVNGDEVTGFADGAYVTINRDPFSQIHEGSKGENTVSILPRVNGEVTIVLSSQSPFNVVLSKLVGLTEPFELVIKNKNTSGFTLTSSDCYILEQPEIQLDKVETSRTWKITLTDMTIDETYTG